MQLTKEQLIDLYISKNYTVNKIALELHIGSATVNRKLKEFNIKKSEDQRRAAISAAKRQKTDDEKAEYTKHVSLARKGKGKGVAPWNKGKHTGNGWSGRHHSEESKQKIKQTKQNKSPEEKAAIEAKRLASRVYGSPWNKDKRTGVWSDELKQTALAKQHETKKKNNSFNSSKPEEMYKQYLINKYGEDDVKAQYNADSRYPFECDFYIKSLDLFIELNLHWSHGNHPFNSESEEDVKKLEIWREKAKTSDFYKNAIETWTVRDVRKIQMAQKNNLNYKAYYTEDELYND